MRDYHPNFADPRTQRRVRHALGFVGACVSDHKPRAWSTRYIDRFLGQQQHALSQWLRQNLLVVTGDRWNKDTGQCKTYVRNTAGYNRVIDQLKNQQDSCENPVRLQKTTTTAIIPYCITSLEQDLITNWAQAEFAPELSRLTFEYQEKSSRLWHPLQRVRRQHKTTILAQAGLPHQYDIVCAAPTLLHQHSWRIPLELNDRGRWQSGPMDLWLHTLRDYIGNRQVDRHQLAERIGIPVATAKTVITALFCGAHISHNSQTHIFRLLAGSHDQIELLKQDSWLQQLRGDIRELWDYINRTIPRRIHCSSGRRLPVNARQKWELYFQLERSVLDSVVQYLNHRHIRHFLEHDGWSTDSELDLNQLHAHVVSQTGFDLQFEYKYIQ